MNRDKEWFKKQHRDVWSDFYSNLEGVGKLRDRIEDLIDQLEEPEKVVIPQFVADWYEQEGSRNGWWNWFYKWGGDQGDSRTELEKRAIEWMQDFNEGLFVDIFRYGYEIEKEPTWVVKLDDDFYVSKIFDGISQFQIDMASGIDVTEAVKFTDKRLAEAVALLVEGNVEEEEK